MGVPFRLPMAASELVPHRPPMLLVDRLVAEDGRGGTVTATITAGPLTGPDGSLEEVGLVELLAQGYAALQGYLDRRDGKPVQMGFLVGVRKVEVFTPPRTNDMVEIHLRPQAIVESFAVVDGEVRRGDELLASGNFKVWISPPDDGRVS